MYMYCWDINGSMQTFNHVVLERHKITCEILLMVSSALWWLVAQIMYFVAREQFENVVIVGLRTSRLCLQTSVFGGFGRQKFAMDVRDATKTFSVLNGIRTKHIYISPWDIDAAPCPHSPLAMGWWLLLPSAFLAPVVFDHDWRRSLPLIVSVSEIVYCLMWTHLIGLVP